MWKQSWALRIFLAKVFVLTPFCVSMLPGNINLQFSTTITFRQLERAWIKKDTLLTLPSYICLVWYTLIVSNLSASLFTAFLPAVNFIYSIKEIKEPQCSPLWLHITGQVVVFVMFITWQRPGSNGQVVGLCEQGSIPSSATDPGVNSGVTLHFPLPLGGSTASESIWVMGRGCEYSEEHYCSDWATDPMLQSRNKGDEFTFFFPAAPNVIL